MKNIGIFYGSTTGNTGSVAEKIAENLGVAAADVYDVANVAPSEVGKYDLIILGASTWGSGDMQDDMQDFLNGVAAMDLSGKKVALFGCGDESMSDTFCNAVGEMYERMIKTGASIIGYFNADGYDYEHTDADVDGKIVGLLIDNMNHEDMTDGRVKAWCELLKAES